ncbi:phosphate ABC transporter substrate-binding/OmpA family protein [Wenxinia marina]|uniref:Phosphate ABC transporter substrate-binding protein, PhoT family n=1 Tax=Wenxinia marina DSM 24838 TaxID=1123501 RepID=A0A0D0Q9A3_9RHOB|nr:phosphate ABC transporter substrate-binding/OmpA family protein [Wenxinia marina]KIQ71004.1 phosphate ABC transporter substrate-binding protein, PhoT family [Wenxinia marina DSM 24838]GGL55620.1 OmpA family protein [Wenxinia marina]
MRLGGMEVTGEALGFDGTYLRVMTDAGEVTLDYRGADCEGPGCPDPATWVPELRLSGAARLGELILPALVEGYARSRGFLATRDASVPDEVDYVLSDGEGGPAFARFAFRLTTTEDGIADLIAREADVAMAARTLSPDELRHAGAAGLGDLSRPGRVRVLALDALVPVAGQGQALSRLSLGDLADMLSGAVADWSEIGGTPAPVRLHVASDDSGQLQGVARRLLGRQGRIGAETVPHPDVAAAGAAAAGDPGGLALLPFEAPGLGRPLTLEGRCGMTMPPRSDAIRAEDYPLATPLMLFLPERRLAEPFQDFLAWLHTTDAQLVLRRAGVLGLQAVPVPVAEQGERLAAAVASAGPEVSLSDLQSLVGFMSGRVRLTPTFRFEGGRAELDAVSRSQVVNLAQAILDGAHDGRPLWLVGFSDAVGPAADNLALALDRAEAVRRAVLQALGGSLPEGVVVNVLAFGEALPIACDDSSWGRALNRRVELWTGAE